VSQPLLHASATAAGTSAKWLHNASGKRLPVLLAMPCQAHTVETKSIPAGPCACIMNPNHIRLVCCQVPLDPQLSRAAEEGRSAFEGAGAAGRSGALPALRTVIDGVLAAVGEPPSASGRLGGAAADGGLDHTAANGSAHLSNGGAHSMEELTGVPVA
jgi:hypothetical protein